MNDRIKALFIQAGGGIEEENGNLWTYSDDLDPELFAQLVVRECINEIAYIGKANEVFGDRTDRGGLNHILWTTETAIEKIKQHFGVE
jgi:uncharacterized protein YjbJ (UPF0337 family)